MKLRSVLLAGAVSLSAVQIAAAQSFSNFIVFGDSNSDSGRYLYIPQTKGGKNFATVGEYTTNPGPQWTVALGQKFGITVTPSDAPGGGNNYAAGGARVTFEGATSNAWSTNSQINAYLASTGGSADPNALFIYYIGINDLKNTTTGGPGNIVSPPNYAALTTLGQQAATQVGTLAAAGARYIVVPNAVAQSRGAAAASGESYSNNAFISHNFYSQTLWNGIAAQGINFIPADLSTVHNIVLTNAAQFGFLVTNLNTPACGPTTGSINCGPANYVTPNANTTYYYADGPLSSTGGGHLTTAAQQIESDYIYSLIVAPSEISYLAEAPVKTRAGVVSAIWNQIPISQGQIGKFHGWVTGDVSSLKMNNGYNGFPSDPGTPVNLTAGFDYRLTSEWLIGAALSVGTTDQTFSLGGDFKENEFAASLYAAYRSDPYWINAVATWGTLHDDVNRQVPIGITVQPNLGSTSGTNISFATEVGYDFKTAVGTNSGVTGMPVKAPTSQLYLTHGPVVGIVLQRVHVNGYTETDQFASVGGLTVLSFGDQTRNSAVTELGYQASLDLGNWQPFAKFAWDHEWASLDRSVTASLTSTVAPSYSMPAVILGRDWGTATVGTRLKLGSGTTGYVAFISELAQNSTTIYGGQIGLNVALDPILTVKATN
jgi:outer membrane lipase/esterase